MIVCNFIYISYILHQGTWFIQIGFILYSPFGTTWDTSNHQQMMIVTIMYVWHYIGAIIASMALGTMAFTTVRKLSTNDIYLAIQHINTKLDNVDNVKLESILDNELSRYMIVPSDEEENC